MSAFARRASARYRRTERPGDGPGPPTALVLCRELLRPSICDVALMYLMLHADGYVMSELHEDERANRRSAHEPDEDVVATAAARLLVAADRAIRDLRAEVERAPREAGVAAEAATLRIEPARPAEACCAELESELDEDRAAVAEISTDLASVRSQLDPLTSGMIGLQNHSLRQTGVVALALAVLIAIAWKVIGG
jgi:hypothetical protein